MSATCRSATLRMVGSTEQWKAEKWRTWSLLVFFLILPLIVQCTVYGWMKAGHITKVLKVKQTDSEGTGDGKGPLCMLFVLNRYASHPSLWLYFASWHSAWLSYSKSSSYSVLQPGIDIWKYYFLEWRGSHIKLMCALFSSGYCGLFSKYHLIKS